MREELLNEKNWHRQEPIDEKAIAFIEKNIDKRLPKTYKNLIRKFNGGVPHIDNFDIPNYEFGGGYIGTFLNLKENRPDALLSFYLEPPESCPKDLIAFGVDGGGNYICFDYREKPDTDNPPIVFWIHDEDPAVWKVADNFDEFLDMLYKDE